MVRKKNNKELEILLEKNNNYKVEPFMVETL